MGRRFYCCVIQLNGMCQIFFDRWNVSNLRFDFNCWLLQTIAELREEENSLLMDRGELIKVYFSL